MQKSDRYYTFTRRSFIVGASKLVLASSLLGRLYYLQVERADHYNTLSQENRIKLKLTPPTRGELLDKFGHALAMNAQYFQLMISRDEISDVDKSIAHLRKYIQLYDADILKAKKLMNRTPAFIPIPLKHGLNWREVSLIEVNQLELPGISIEEGTARDYPHSEVFAHPLGYVQPITEQDNIDRKYFRLPNFKVGRSGVEKMFDPLLRGEPGSRQAEVNAAQREVRLLSHRPSRGGKNLKLTLDTDLQKMAYHRLAKENSGACVIMDVNTGAILAMVSAPGYDPNLFVDGIDHKTWKELNENKYDVLVNKATSGQYHPGSTFKMVVALAGLESGLISPNDVIYCGGGVQFGKHFFNCWKKGGHGAQDMRAAIAGSCNTYFYLLAQKVGIDRIHHMAIKMGLGEKTQLNFHNERPGTIPSTQWKRKRFNQPWWPGETLTQGIGQGYVTATPLQLCQAAARYATGKQVIPRLYMPNKPDAPDKSDAPQGKLTGSFAPLDIKPSSLQIIREGMYRVVNGPGGTAMRHMIKEKGWEMAGKTGTAQVASLSTAKAKQTSKDPYVRWKHQNHALFTAFAPYYHPRYAICVLLEHGKKSTFAAGAAREIMHYLLTLRGPKPHGTTKPQGT